jgi:hypothetical protein
LVSPPSFRKDFQACGFSEENCCLRVSVPWTWTSIWDITDRDWERQNQSTAELLQHSLGQQESGQRESWTITLMEARPWGKGEGLWNHQCESVTLILFIIVTIITIIDGTRD